MLGREAIRLVIWDLDETFWRGTLTEGGIREYVEQHHNIVIELAKRGIISSICSKNNYADIEKILTERGLWDYFILPSIDWTPKGPRLKALIEDIQLRPETVLFIDDNAGNRAEAAAHIPGLQIADETIIPNLLSDALLQGKDDAALTRLKQYQLLQRRKQDEKSATDNAEFLRSSNIRVTIEPNIKLHLDRAIELINRTNQLNFTKLRLPDDNALAKEELIKLTSKYYVQAGLVRVSDNYGDYGFCGLYITFSMHDIRKLTHFCFSCRILGMGVERWLYRALDKPDIKINGEVLTQLDSDETINWINQDIDGALRYEGEGNAEDVSVKKKMLFPEIRMAGGCELDALSHYFRQDTPTLRLDANYVNGGFLVRRDMTANIALSLSPLDERIKKEIEVLGMQQKDFNSQFFASALPGTLFIISTWGDLYLPVYTHKELNFDIGVALRLPGIHNLTRVTPEALENYLPNTKLPLERQEEIRRIVQHMKAHYSAIGRVRRRTLREDWAKIFAAVPQDCSLAVLLPNTNRGGQTSFAQEYHATVQETASSFPHIFTVDVTAYIDPTEDSYDGAVDHLNRMAYFRTYKHLLAEFERRRSMVAPSTPSNPPLSAEMLIGA